MDLLESINRDQFSSNLFLSLWWLLAKRGVSSFFCGYIGILEKHTLVKRMQMTLIVKSILKDKGLQTLPQLNPYNIDVFTLGVIVYMKYSKYPMCEKEST